VPGSIVLAADTLAARLNPERTVLFLGAGASVPSGAPTGGALAVELSQQLANGEIVSRELTEAATILENRYGRKALVEDVIRQLKPLEPAGGMLALPEFNWYSIYTTNFDQIVEKAYARARKPVNVIKSNYDWERLESEDGTPLFKIHGCISGDVVLGHK
jgi:NAD-dependent SIR2 family protein deacetylase